MKRIRTKAENIIIKTMWIISLISLVMTLDKIFNFNQWWQYGIISILSAIALIITMGLGKEVKTSEKAKIQIYT